MEHTYIYIYIYLYIYQVTETVYTFCNYRGLYIYIYKQYGTITKVLTKIFCEDVVSID